MDPGGGGALFDEPGVVDDQDTIVLAELVGDVFLQVVADVVRVPLRSGEQVLQVIGRGVAGLFGQLPAVLSGHRGEQAVYVVTHAAAELDPAEAVPDVHEEVIKFKGPLRGGMLGDHPRRLPRRCYCQQRCRTIEGRPRRDRSRTIEVPLRSRHPAKRLGQTAKSCWSTSRFVRARSRHQQHDSGDQGATRCR